MSIDMDLVNSALVTQRSASDAATAQAANAANAKKTTLDQGDFLTLMITQLKNQDPFKPLDPTQYVGQLAQFSSVSGLADMNKNISALTSSLRGNQVLDGAGLIGRTIIAQGKNVYLPEGGSGAQGLIDVPGGTSAVQMVVKDSSGATVRTLSLDSSQGQHAFSWDGTTDSGAAAKAGNYQIEAVAKVGDKNVSLPTSVATRVASVALDPSTGGLVLDTETLGDVNMTAVERVL
ncbi:MAG TPA: flagellar hook capping FlgD N-terminal domain-containing protein [Steroidobacteraceae bacterium]|jgi:flagellar basal-body rod modification protein FlgD|nr:flagellar hook capping FlgD N-terminal domain-containing protein [Steroidobacteraceae bacterium]